MPALASKTYESAVERLRLSKKFQQWQPRHSDDSHDSDDLDKLRDVNPTIRLEASFEKHYSVTEVASMWGISVDLVRDIFQR